MNKLIVHPTDMAQWLALIHEAQQHSCIQLHEELESYLVFLLMKYTGQPSMVSSVLGLEFLESSNCDGITRQQRMKDIGDKCLLFSGLFPERAKRRRVQLKYFIQLGQSAYSYVSCEEQDDTSQLYSELAIKFPTLREVIAAVRIHEQPQAQDLSQQFDLAKKHGPLTNVSESRELSLPSSDFNSSSKH